MADDDDELSGFVGDDRIVHEARKRFLRCRDWQSDADANWLKDTKFAHGDARNGWQWPDTIYRDRSDEQRPCLTINKTRVHNNIIINAALQNKSSIKIRPTGGSASYQGSQAMQALIRRVEYISKADSVYETAIRHQVDGGIGYVFLETKYANDRTFDQDIFYRRCKDPRCVYLDPDIREPDGLDANFGFIFEPMSREQFNKKHKEFKNKVGQSALGNDDIWLTNTDIQVAMYYRRNGKKDKFVSYVEPDSQKRVEKLASEIKDESGRLIAEALLLQIKNGDIDGKVRDVFNETVEWFMIAGDTIIDRGKWAGRYIPIVRCVGIETVIEGKLDRKGHTRAMIDAQRMLNYNCSGSIEYGALQAKSPWVGPARAFEGQEQWKDANKKNYAFLAYNDVDEEATEGLQQIEAPQRTQPPTSAPVYMQGMQDAERQLMMVSGQYQSQMGEEDQQAAASGKAINERQRQGDVATYHFIEHQGDMLRALGVQTLDLIPKIYDTERLLHVLGEDGTKQWIQIAPDQEESINELKQEDDEAATLSFNPAVGEYDCMADPGPNYATQRQEAWNAISLILQQNMELASTIGDLLFKFGDFPGADEIMQRLKKEIQASKPYLFNDAQAPGMVALQNQLGQFQKLNGELVQKVAEMQLALKGKDEKRDVEASNAETNRLKAMIEFMSKVVLSPKDRAMMEHEIMGKTHDAALDMIVQANAAQLEPDGGTSAGSDNGPYEYEDRQ